MNEMEESIYSMLKILEGKSVREGFLSLLSFNLVFVQQLLAAEPDMPEYVKDWIIDSYNDLAATTAAIVQKSKEQVH